MLTLNEALKIAGLSPRSTADDKAKALREAFEAVGKPLNEDFDIQRTQREAQDIVKMLKDQFHVPIDTKNNKDGSITIIVNNGHSSNTNDNNPHIVTSKNLGTAIDRKFREFRQKGWVFSQPVHGEFTIGVN